MPTQIAKLDFWNYNNYKTADTTLTTAETSDYILKASGGMLQLNQLGLFIRSVSGIGAFGNQRYYGDTCYLRGSRYYHNLVTFQSTGSSPIPTIAGLSAINAANGFELHYNMDFSQTYNTTSAGFFIIDSKTFRWKWTTNEGLVLYQDATKLTFDNANSADYTTNYVDNDAAPNWFETRVRAFVINDGANNNTLYVQIKCNYAGSSVFGYKTIPLTAGETKPNFTGLRNDLSKNTTFRGALSNYSLYTISSAEATTYAAAISTNTLAPFQRYAPMLDLVPIFGDEWETDDVATPWTALTDGDLTTAAYTEQKGKPIGFIASDGTQNTITSGEWYMVATGGVGLDFSTVGGQAVGTLHNVFLATAGATIGTDSVYQLLTFGDIYSRCYSWTPGTLTQLPTIGLIRNGGSMGFSVANTEAENITYYFGMFDNVAAGGANVSTYKYISTDILTSGNPFGETLASSEFSDTGIFNGHQFATWQPVIFALERKPD
jgi:hypothetical protein